MKKIIVFLMCVFATISAVAEVSELPCNGGSNITAKNGTKFCKSDQRMNWWSAFAWCDSQNLKLADLATMCPNTSQTPAGTAGDCPNLQDVGEGPVWSSLANGDWKAIYVSLPSGAVDSANRTHATSQTYAHYHALCSE